VSSIDISVDGSKLSVALGSDGFKLFTDKKIVAMRVNGQLKDLAHQVSENDIVEGIHISSQDGLAILRHSTAHVAAQALQSINPNAKLGFGPPITDGFYYDFDVAEPLTP
jgi:threonyl-tRNA synthetase